MLSVYTLGRWLIKQGEAPLTGFVSQKTVALFAYLVAHPVCTRSPTSQLSVGMVARTVQPDGTLAMRLTLQDPYPTYQLPAGLEVQGVEGPQCRDEARMWRVTTSLNGQRVTGWVSEGWVGLYFLMPQ
ncbi:MAG: hypothetical protein HC915_16675 [Anaerolineae bacterium]|nr:hypothetical protein [Anaerolineae bacterium]